MRPGLVGAARTEGSILRPVVVLSSTFALGTLLNLITFVVDRRFVGQVGTLALAALGSAHAALMIVVTFAMGLAIGTLSGVARNIGAGRSEDAARVLVNGLYVGLCFGVLALGCAFLAPAHLMAAMGADPGVSGPAAAYLGVTLGGLLLHAPLMMLIFGFQGAGLVRQAFLLAAVPALLNAALDYPFIFTLGLGVVGAAWAGVVAHAVGLTLGVYLLFHSPLRPPTGAYRPSLEVARRSVAIGIPGSLEHMVRTVAGFALVSIITRFGPAFVSAYTSGQVVLMLLIAPGIAVGQATAALVGQNLGAGKPRRAWDTVWTAAGLYAAATVLAGLGVFAGADRLIGLFDASPEVMVAGAEMLRYAVFCLPLLAVAMTVSRAFAGAGNTLPMMVVAAVAHLGVQIPAAVLLSRALGPPGAYIGLCLAFTVHGLLAAALFVRRFGVWRRDVATPAQGA